MLEIGTSGLMSGDGKRSDGQSPQATAPILDSTQLAGSASRAASRSLASEPLETPLTEKNFYIHQIQKKYSTYLGTRVPFLEY
jgi:hypothetical protein